MKLNNNKRESARVSASVLADLLAKFEGKKRQAHGAAYRRLNQDGQTASRSLIVRVSKDEATSSRVASVLVEEYQRFRIPIPRHLRQQLKGAAA